MATYKDLYFKLFNALTDTVKVFQEVQIACEDECCQAENEIEFKLIINDEKMNGHD